MSREKLFIFYIFPFKITTLFLFNKNKTGI
nr:MAG TPA: hypothetical protein [Caudoviricetes sp.]